MGSTAGTYYDTNNALAAVHQLIGAGYTKEQAAGIVGNLAAESGVLPSSVQKGGPGRGIAQWSQGDRYQQLLNWASANHLNAANLNVQVNFLVKELHTTESNAGRAVKSATTVEQAAAAFLVLDERPANQSAANQAHRGAVAKGILDLYNASPTGAANAATGPPMTGAGGGDGNEVVSSIGGAVTGAVGAVTGAGSVLGDIGTITKHLNDPSFWIRIAFVIGGLVLVFIAASKLSGGTVSSPGGGLSRARPAIVPV